MDYNIKNIWGRVDFFGFFDTMNIVGELRRSMLWIKMLL